MRELGKDGAVIGLSGGLDSAVCAYLLTEALGKNRVLGLILAERNSVSVNMEDTRMVAKNLGIKTIEVDLAKLLNEVGIYKVGLKESETKEGVEGFKKMQKFTKFFWY